MPVQTRTAGIVDGEPHPRPPAESTRVSGHRLDDDIAVDPGQPVQLLGHDGRLEPALLDEVDVLPVAATTPARSCPRTRRRHPGRSRAHDLDRIRTQVGAPLLGDPHLDPFTGQGVADEDNTALGPARDAHAAVRHALDVDEHYVSLPS